MLGNNYSSRKDKNSNYMMDSSKPGSNSMGSTSLCTTDNKNVCNQNLMKINQLKNIINQLKNIINLEKQAPAKTIKHQSGILLQEVIIRQNAHAVILLRERIRPVRVLHREQLQGVLVTAVGVKEDRSGGMNKYNETLLVSYCIRHNSS